MHKKVMAGWRRPIELAVNDVVEHFFRQHDDAQKQNGERNQAAPKDTFRDFDRHCTTLPRSMAVLHIIANS